MDGAASWTIYAQDLPPAARHFDDIPADHEPAPLGSRAGLAAAIRKVEPSAAFIEAGFGFLRGEGFRLEIELGERENVESIAFRVQAACPVAGLLADRVVARILSRLGLSAFDPRSPSGLFAHNPG
ncbi:MAG: hypothetical protein KIT20_08185 [Alphaproteobacteria bacterium]|nr:hypothetical protein [Alphaproteobacteria bacterium]